ncbi:MAG: class I SAM-dependent methyltransferase [Luteimonas sp.]|nr:class I SAM-dependent methyltransferase [Luteimonas sp.]
MAHQYQTFPDAIGHSLTLEKLKQLCLPDLGGKSFLDVGCNEGFFCGFAHFQGATQVLGIDGSKAFIDLARKRFPACEFLHQTWDVLPDRKFDVILLASALHYAANQPALIRALVERLTDDGMLVLELGIYSSTKSKWQRVDRGFDQPLFPTMPKLRRMLARYAWKWMGPSVNQPGDPVPRHVIHISRRKPVAYLLMQPPGYGKSSLATGLFPKAEVPVVSGDEQLGLAASGQHPVSDALKALLDREYSPFRLDRVVGQAFDAGLGEDLVGAWLGDAATSDVALDVYVPAKYQAEVERLVIGMGYLPVRLEWQRVGPSPLPGAVISQQAEAFYLSLLGQEADASAGDGFRCTPAGHVDEVVLESGRLAIKGWAIDDKGKLPAGFSVRIGRKTIGVDAFDRQLRPDVQQHLGLPHALVGFRLHVDAQTVRSPADLAGFQVIANGGVVLVPSATMMEGVGKAGA